MHLEGGAAADRATTPLGRTSRGFRASRLRRSKRGRDRPRRRGAGASTAVPATWAAWLQFQLAGGKFDGRRLITEKALKETHTPQMLVEAGGVVRGLLPRKGHAVHQLRPRLVRSRLPRVTCVSHGGTLTGFRAVHARAGKEARRVRAVQPAAVAGVRNRVQGRSTRSSDSRRKTGSSSTSAQMAVLDFNIAAGKKKREAARKPDNEAEPRAQAVRGRLRRTGLRAAQR